MVWSRGRDGHSYPACGWEEGGALMEGGSSIWCTGKLGDVAWMRLSGCRSSSFSSTLHGYCDNSSGGRGAEGGWVEERGVRKGVRQEKKIPLRGEGF